MANCRALMALTGAGLLMMGGSVGAQSTQIIPDGYHQVARAAGIPAEALYSISLAETARQLPQGERPWPWTLNVAGKGYRYSTRQEAYEALLGFIRRYPLKRIDVGIAQVNIGWNGQYFDSYWDALDPYTNLQVAARILKACYAQRPGSWLQAAGCYHHPAGGKPAQTYKAIVRRKLASLDLSAPEPKDQPMLLAQASAASSTQFHWVEPRESKQ